MNESDHSAIAPLKRASPLVLMVEDSPTQAGFLRSVLEAENYEVAHATNGVEALDLMELRLPNLIISDVMMPVMDGYEFCRRVKADARFRPVPFMLLTMLGSPQDIFKGLDSGADFYGVKPAIGPVLLERLRAILDHAATQYAPNSSAGIEVTYAGAKYSISAGRSQILDLLLATFESIAQKNHELVESNRKLQEANQKLAEALEANKTLHGLLPICSYCKKIRDDKNYWHQVENFVARRSSAKFSHGICPDCLKKAMSDLGMDPDAEE